MPVSSLSINSSDNCWGKGSRSHRPRRAVEGEAQDAPGPVALWVLQIGLAFLDFAEGGAYKVVKFDEIANQMAPIARVGSGAVGVIEMVGAVLLIVPAVAKRMPVLAPLAAAALALESLALAGLYARHSLELAATNPLVWSVAMGMLAAFVAYGRYALRPPARRPAVAPSVRGLELRAVGPQPCCK
jgi:hypothetical protein